MTTYVPPKKNTELIFYIGLDSVSTSGAFQSDPTIASGDFKVSTDGGALANLSTLPAVTPASSKLVKITVSASEMNGDNIMIVGSDAAGAEWKDVVIHIHTSTRQLDDLPSDPADNSQILAAISASGSGAGAFEWDITITVDGNPVDGVDIWISTDSAGTNVIARLQTDDNGVATFMLDAGTYYAWKQLAGYTFANPESFTVT